MTYYVYILTNVTNTVVYTGVTKDLIRRMYEHKHNVSPNSFSARYDVHKLVYILRARRIFMRQLPVKSRLRAGTEKEKTNWSKAKILFGRICMNPYCCKGNGLPHQSADWFAMTY